MWALLRYSANCHIGSTDHYGNACIMGSLSRVHSRIILCCGHVTIFRRHTARLVPTIFWMISIGGRRWHVVDSNLITEPSCRIAVTPPFPGLQHFKHSRGFKQWMGDDLKALMKVNTTVAGVFWDAKHISRCIYHLLQNMYLLHLSPNFFHCSSISVISCAVQKLASQISLPLKWRWRHFMWHMISSIHLAYTRRVSIFHASTPWCNMCI